ncbi:hypothetical protein Emed_002543 [Eimeria media]
MLEWRRTGSSTVGTPLTAAAAAATAATAAATAAAAAAAGDVQIMGFMRKRVLLLQRQQQQHSRSWVRSHQVGVSLVLLLLLIAAAATANGDQTSTDVSASNSAASARPEEAGKPAATTAAAAAGLAASFLNTPPTDQSSTAAASGETGEPAAAATAAPAAGEAAAAAAGEAAAAAAAGAAAAEAAAAAAAGAAAGAEMGRMASVGMDERGGVFGVQGEAQDEGNDEGDRQLIGLGGPGGLFARTRPVFAPFVRHYSKYMAILWEWYTKTIGATMNGRRRQDEDALVVHAPALWLPNVRFKAVFDGHGGPAVSRTCVAQFCNFYGNMPDLSSETFTNASLLLDAYIREDPMRHRRGGSTGLVVAIERPHENSPKFKIHVSNVGDSRAFILHKDGTYTIMSKDHKPNDPIEAARIAKAGGFVSRVRKIFRVDGTLSVSRAFGDIQKVIAVPDVRTFDAREGDYIFMACDGMFEAPGMSWDFVANLLHRELQNTQNNLVETAFRMLNTAYLLGSADNISIVLTKLMNRKRSSSTVKRFTYDYSGKRRFVDSQMFNAPNDFRSGTYHTASGPMVTLF